MCIYICDIYIYIYLHVYTCQYSGCYIPTYGGYYQSDRNCNTNYPNKVHQLRHQCPWHTCPWRTQPKHPSRTDSCENRSWHPSNHSPFRMFQPLPWKVCFNPHGQYYVPAGVFFLNLRPSGNQTWQQKNPDAWMIVPIIETSIEYVDFPWPRLMTTKGRDASNSVSIISLLWKRFSRDWTLLGSFDVFFCPKRLVLSTYGGFLKWGYPKMDCFTIEKPAKVNWNGLFGGSPLSGNFHRYMPLHSISFHRTFACWPWVSSETRWCLANEPTNVLPITTWCQRQHAQVFVITFQWKMLIQRVAFT